MDSVEVGGVELVDAWRTEPDTVIWLDLHENPDALESDLLTDELGLHELAVQDAQRNRHPPKLEIFDHYTFLLFKGLHADEENIDFGTIQLALFVSDRFLVTRRSGPSPSTARLWEESGKDQGLFRRGPDALALRLLRIMIGRYLGLVLSLERRLEQLEAEIVERPRDEVLSELLGYKTVLKKYRRVFTYHVQILNEVRTHECPGFSPEEAHVANDVYEQQERANSLAGLYYELASDLIDGYISLASHRLNNIMKILTIITAIFVPLGFLAGIYGMNFEYMPELKSRAGYFVLLGVMATIVVSLLYLFKKKKWL